MSRQPLLVPVDGSAFAERALPLSIFIAERLRRPIHLVRVLDAAHGPGAYGVEHALHYVHDLGEQVRARGLTCQTTVVVDETVSALLDLSQADQAFCLSVVCHGLSEPGRWVLGTTADRLVQRSLVPVLVQTGATLAKPERVLGANGPIIVPLDGSEVAEIAIPEATRLARALRRGVTLVRAEESARSWRGQQSTARAADTGIEDSLAYLRRIARIVRRQGIDVSITTGTGEPARLIQETAERQDGFMVVMTARGQSGLGRLTLGDVADAALRTIAVPVFLLGPLVVQHRLNARQRSLAPA